MADPILDEIQRVRQELIKRHGGLKGLLDYVQKLDRAHRNAQRRRKLKRAARRRGKPAS